VPERVQRRYFTEERGGGGLAFYVDATVTAAAFRDHGDRLRATRNDPNVIRDVVAIAAHRGWTIVTVQGEARFRREAWLAGRVAGLEVRGYRATERDVQELGRRMAARDRLSRDDRPPSGAAAREPTVQDRAGAHSRLRLVDAVVRARVADADEQGRILAAARARISGWLERGARFDEAPARARSVARDRSRS
ncbi:MAG: LPD7 domain-containing protein, partial [Phenylobacterium sp.]